MNPSHINLIADSGFITISAFYISVFIAYQILEFIATD